MKQFIYNKECHIYGATANSSDPSRRFVTMSGGKHKPWVYGAGVYPFGCHFSGSNLGHCIYQLTKIAGWNSTQFTQMPTGAGGKKYCNYPEYDYEIVYISDKDTVCNTEMKMIDPTVDFANYNDLWFCLMVQEFPTLKKFNAQKMRLSERNVPDGWNKPLPNSIFYNQPLKFIPDTSICPYEDEVYNPWAEKHGGGINPYWYTSENYYCPNKSSCDNKGKKPYNDPGCKYGEGMSSDTCCWNYNTGKPDSSVCKWPSLCMATSKRHKDGSAKIFDNYCTNTLWFY